jgi:hypothetical protein
MAESYSRPSGGFSFSFSGLNTKNPPDKLSESKYPIAQNIRGYDDKSIRSRPGLAQIATSATGNPVTAVRAYAAIETDNQPRYLFKADVSSTSASIFLDTNVAVDTGYAAQLGASLITYRPNQSPQSYMYIGDANQYRKISAPTSTNTVTAQKVGIAEPQIPVDAGMSAQNFSYVGAPVAATYTNTGTASAITNGSRITDTVQGVFPDPTGCGITTLQVSPNNSALAPGVYKTGAVSVFFWTPGDTSGVFRQNFPLDPSTAVQTATGNSFEFNGPTFWDPPTYQPMLWGVLTGDTISGSTIPFTGATTNYTMVVLGNLFVPQAGSYTININHDDGMFFAISGATLVSGPVNDAGSHTQTAVSGYTFTGGGIAGNNQHGTWNDTFVINFPAAGTYPIEVDYAQNDVFQTLEVLFNGGLIIDAGSSPGYQRYMALEIGTGTNPVTVQDVFPPLPSQLAIESIFYYAGTTGKCVITPASLSPVSGTDGTSLYEQNLLSGLRRGALVQVGSEVCLVLDVTNGPTGTVCFETTTVANHTTADSLFGVSAISIFGTATVGEAISSEDIIFSVATGAGASTGIGAISMPVVTNPFVSDSFSFQTEDNIHFSMNIEDLINLNEMKILFDVGDGTFEQNFYFYTVRPNDIVAGISNQLTQLGVAQLVNQRATIDEAEAAESGNQGFTSSSAQTTTGDSQWSEILFPISALTRVGNDQTKSLQNVNAVQILFNVSGSLAVEFNSLSVFGGFSPDVGQVGAPYQYIIRGRSSVTGALSNPSPAMRYGVTTRRGQVSVFVPTSYSDPQVDTWDVFRFGGSLTTYTFIGSVPIGSSNQFIDTYEDGEIVSNETIDYENFEPWPTIDLPLNMTASIVSGTVAIVAITGDSTRSAAAMQANVKRYLPGNLVQIQQQVYTLWTRPTQIGTSNNFLFQFVENAGDGVNQTVNIYEPAMANQILPYLWGPTEEGGNIFGCGDPLRPGFVSFTKNFQPDSAPDNYNIELCPPSEPLLGGEVLNGNSYAASTGRWWQLRPSFGGENQYTPNEVPVGRGLAAPFGHCTDGSRIYFVAKDGIYATSGGVGISLTDADLYNLFPHEGVPGQNVTYNGITNFAPDYGRAETFRLAYCNSYLYFDYQDSTGVPRTLVFDVRHQGWSTDVYLGGVGASIHYGIEQQEGSLDLADLTYGLLIVGSANGSLYKEVDNSIDAGVAIACFLGTREFTAGDERAQKLFGDLFLDFLNPASGVTNLSAKSLSLGVPFSTTALSQSNARQQVPIDLSGGTYSFSLGLFLSWTVSAAGSPVTFYTWQPSYIVKPETTANRAEDWDNAGYEGAKWIQGFILEANTNGATKQLQIQNGDTQAIQQTFSINHPIQQEKAYSFLQPFVAHMMRWESVDGIDWSFFNIKWIWQKTPETVTTWWTQPSSLGWGGYGHVYTINAAYASQAPVVFTMFFDGNSQVYTLPSTGGVYQKIFINLQANKGKLYSFRFQSTAANPDLQMWEEDFVCEVGGWGRTEVYRNYVTVGGSRGDKAAI